MSVAAAPAAVAAAPATMGMSLLLPLLMSFGPSIFSKLFGGDPQQNLRDQINKLLASQGALTNQNYQTNISSPAYSQGQGVIAAGANQTGNNVAESLGARGLSGSGTRDVLSGLLPSLVGSQLAGLKTTAWNSAQGQAQNTIQEQLDALMKTSGPSQNQNLFAGGLEAFQPYLQAYLRSKYPQLSSMGQQSGTPVKAYGQ
jgi:type IV secretory pathway TrbL component